jgi:hypothetical protein
MDKLSSAHYRIVTDILGNFEVQTWRWWWPFWTQEQANTHRTMEDAIAYATTLARRGHVVRVLGRLPLDDAAPAE